MKRNPKHKIFLMKNDDIITKLPFPLLIQDADEERVINVY